MVLWTKPWCYTFLLHFYDMISSGIPMLWCAISMLSYKIFKNDMIWYTIVWYAMLWDLSKRSQKSSIFKVWFTGLISSYKSTFVIVLHIYTYVFFLITTYNNLIWLYIRKIRFNIVFPGYLRSFINFRNLKCWTCLYLH